MTAWQLELATNDLEAAKAVFEPLAGQDIGISDDNPGLTVRWDEPDVRRGALENFSTLLG